jgi:hypothetical protein
MDKVEARSILEAFVDELQSHSREDLLGLIANPICIEKKGQSGAVYQIEYEALWDAEPGGDLRVMASIDDGRFLSAFKPLSAGFLVSPQGKVRRRDVLRFPALRPS